ncbi:hypothetical protein MN116_000899 [Schistosoma mekongi]|uniref:Uncharacterized protein n=1 Tax=Schistosoma mekongi TaxID=38744 RepID=A0AAE1ZLS7_SCHME|nr:hypothetical protein MN116_000899 [Schistosoma mekongi]
MLAESMGFLAVCTHLAWNYYLLRPLYAHIYRTVLLGGSTYMIIHEVNKMIDRKKVIHLKAIDYYKSQFPDRVPVKSYQTYGEVLRPWKPLR